MTRTPVFLCGAMGDAELREIVVDARQADWAPAEVSGFALCEGAGSSGGVLVARAGATVQGLWRRLSPDALARLTFYAQSTGLTRANATLKGSGQSVQVFAFWDAVPDLPAWDQDRWRRLYADIDREAARDAMRLMGEVAGEVLQARNVQMRVRAASRLRAAIPAPSTRRMPADPDAVAIRSRRQPYSGYFAVEEYDLTVRRFDGATGPEINRVVFITGDAVTVLPYDPCRDRVLLIEQFRAGPMARGDPVPFSLEAIAGRIDPGEMPEAAARREAVEEAGLTLGRFWPVATYYPSPAGKSEFLYSYVAEAELPDGIAGVHGLADEAEDIRGHLVGFDDLMDMVASGEVGNAPVILTALWLQRERPRLRRLTGSG